MSHLNFLDKLDTNKEKYCQSPIYQSRQKISNIKLILRSLDEVVKLSIRVGALDDGRFLERGMEQLKSYLGAYSWPLYSRSVANECRTDLPLTRLLHLALVNLGDYQAVQYRGLPSQHSYLIRLQGLRRTAKDYLRTTMRAVISKVGTVSWKTLVRHPRLGGKEEAMALLYYISQPWILVGNKDFNLTTKKLDRLLNKTSKGRYEKPLKKIRTWLQAQGFGIINEVSFKNGVNRIIKKDHIPFLCLSDQSKQLALSAISYCCK